MLLRTSCLTGLFALLLAPATAAADGFDLEGDLEYRADTTYINPFELGGTRVTHGTWTDQRLRTDWRLRHPGTVELHLQADILSGVLFGDTGSYGGDPSTNSGVSIATKQPNTTTWDIGLRKGDDPL